MSTTNKENSKNNIMHQLIMLYSVFNDKGNTKYFEHMTLYIIQVICNV